MTADPWSPDAGVIGVDFGTPSGRAVVIRAADGAELGAAIHDYRHGVMDARLAATADVTRRPLGLIRYGQGAVCDRAVRERVGDDRAGQARAQGGRS